MDTCRNEPNRLNENAPEVLLWSILDDIDTLSDIYKPNDLKGYILFYEDVMKRVEKRHKILTSDGYNLFRP